MWTFDISSIIFTRIKIESTKILSGKYPNLNFTTSDKVQTTAKFPTVLVRELGSVENAPDLENTGINSVITTFQIDVTDNQSQSRAREVMATVTKIMKQLKFTVIAIPEFGGTGETYRMTARFRRVIDWNDIV